MRPASAFAGSPRSKVAIKFQAHAARPMVTDDARIVDDGGSSGSTSRAPIAGRDGGRESNVVFRLPEETVLDMWRRCIAAAYTPEAIYRRFAHNLAHTFAKRPPYPRSRHRASWRNVMSGLALLGRIVWRIGVRGDYRGTFWRVAGPALRRGQIEEMIQAAVVSHHLIEFTRVEGDYLAG